MRASGLCLVVGFCVAEIVSVVVSADHRRGRFDGSRHTPPRFLKLLVDGFLFFVGHRL
jgi:hypothetical protein